MRRPCGATRGRPATRTKGAPPRVVVLPLRRAGSSSTLWSMRRPRLVIPTKLLATMLVVPACGDDGGDDTSASSASASDTSTSDGSASDTDSSSVHECADITDQTACVAETRWACWWNANDGECEIDCPAYTDEASCNEQILCAWDDNAGCVGPI